MNRDHKVFNVVKSIYENSETRPMGLWMWNNHVQWVADKTRQLAIKYSANEETAVSAALLHDLADSRYERNDPKFDEWSEEKALEILKGADFTEEEAKEIIEVVIRPHSCRPDNLPTTLEGKVLATADAMFHLQTSFFTVLCYKNMPASAKSLEEWQTWFEEKVERDYGSKIFFDDEKNEVTSDYEALKRVFGNKSLKEIL